MADANELKRALTVLHGQMREAQGWHRIVPQACASCQHRQPEWRDGGWCFMFLVMPVGTCAQFKASS